MIRSTLYPRLIDHDVTKCHPDVVGLRDNVFWLDHRNSEDGPGGDAQTKSQSNTWEAEMTMALVRHVIRQGVYKSSDIAVLTPYTGQLQLLRQKLSNEFEIMLSERDEEELANEGFLPNEVQTFGSQPAQKKQLSKLLRYVSLHCYIFAYQKS